MAEGKAKVHLRGFVKRPCYTCHKECKFFTPRKIAKSGKPVGRAVFYCGIKTLHKKLLCKLALDAIKVQIEPNENVQLSFLSFFFYVP